MVVKYALVVLLATLSVTSALPKCICTREMKPVCGSNGRTYANKCLLECESTPENAIDVARQGVCEQAACICTYEYRPVCGSNGETYSNECALRCAQSMNPSLSMRNIGSCETQPLKSESLTECACARNMKPICGSDGKTYSNPCLLECSAKFKSGLTKAHEGRCINEVSDLPKTEPFTPACVCNKDLKPVCGSDGVTYNNECQLGCAAAVSRKAIRVNHEGPCEVERNCACGRSFKPVCGSDGISYNNPCLLKCTGKGLRVASEGFCES